MASLTISKTGQALREARERRGITQAEAGAIGLVDNTMVSQIETGRRRLQRDVGRRIGQALDDGRCYMALAEEATGGVSSPWLDGHVDLGRVAVWAKLAEELIEAGRAVERVMPLVIRPPDALTDEQRARIREALHEQLEARTAIDLAVAVLCRETGESVRRLNDEHRAELRAKGYLGG